MSKKIEQPVGSTERATPEQLIIDGPGVYSTGWKFDRGPRVVADDSVADLEERGRGRRSTGHGPAAKTTPTAPRTPGIDSVTWRT
jgi:hypothetical protein